MNLQRWAARFPGLVVAESSTWEAMVRGSAGVLAVTSMAQILALVLQILFARLLGPSEFGVYSVVIAGLGLALILAKLGLDTTMIRLVAEFTAKGDPRRVRGLVAFARTLGLVAGCLGGVGVLVLAVRGFAREDQALRQALVVGAAFLPLAVSSELTAAALRGLRRVTVALVGDGIVRPCVALGGLLLMAAWWPAGLTGANALLVYLIGTVASLVFTSLVLRGRLLQVRALVAVEDMRRYLSISAPLMLASGLLVATYSVDTLMLGSLADTTAAGYYAVALRIAMFVLFVMNAAQMMAAPLMAAARVSGEPAALRGVVRTLNGLAILAAVPASILFLVAAEPILTLFGPDFEAAAPALRVLVLAQLLNVLTGPTGTVLSMTGHERTLSALLAAGLGLNIVLNLAWIPAYGLVGAAAAWLVAQSFWNILGVVVIRLRFGIDVTLFDLLRRSASRDPG